MLGSFVLLCRDSSADVTKCARQLDYFLIVDALPATRTLRFALRSKAQKAALQ